MSAYELNRLLFEVLSDKKYRSLPAGRNEPVVFPQESFFAGSDVTVMAASGTGEVCHV